MSYLLLLALIPPFVWGAVNHIDKYAVERFMQGRDPGALILFTGVAAMVMSVVLYLCTPVHLLDVHTSARMILAGTILVFSYIPYLYALSKDEASNVAPLFQLVTPCVYILAFLFLHETISIAQLFAGGLIFFGALTLSFDFGSARVRARSFGLMLLTSSMIACNVVAFKSFALANDFWTTAFYDLIGASIAGIVLFVCIPRYRKAFVSTIREFGGRVIGVNMLAETLNIGARLLNGFVSLGVPLMITQFIIGLQPLFILTTGIVLTLVAPRLGKEAIDASALTRKFAAVILMLAGIVLLAIVT